MERLAFLWKVVVGAAHLAVKAESTATRYIKRALSVAGVAVAVVFLERLTVSLSDGSELAFHPPLGLAITAALLVLFFAACLGASWVMAPRLAFLPEIDCRTYDGHLGVYLFNRSWGTTVKRVRVVLAELAPNPLRPVGVPLHCSGCDIPTEHVDLHPRDKRLYDVIQARADGTWIVTGYHLGYRPELKPARYRVVLRAEGENVAPATCEFVLDVGPAGPTLCRATGPDPK